MRPALDLLRQVGDLADGDIVDLGCGNGPVGPALAEWFAGRDIIGVDTSPAMLAAAEETGSYTQLIRADAARWQPKRPPALIFSNALCHWLGDHASLFPRLCDLLAPGCALAVQMPRQYHAPSHALLRQIAQAEFPSLFDFSHQSPPVAEPRSYVGWLAELGELNIWETEYFQHLEPVNEGHPVRHFTGSTAMRPFLEKLDDVGQALLTSRYDQALERAYPLDNSGAALFPFRRLFFVLTR
ncbi:MAG: methyltransferase domain-containing protein [Marinosulfonomonas sp.]|nr:methyltransferase domain-containing protein [Marinosulfonomonas sp.]